jgi:inosine-uridine nucleoside N-ribohydrolase
LALRVLQGWFAEDPQRQRFEFYDPLAMAMAIDPAVATMRPVSLAVGTEPGELWGETTVIRESGPVSLGQRVDAPRFFALLGELFAWSGL